MLRIYYSAILILAILTLGSCKKEELQDTNQPTTSTPDPQPGKMSFFNTGITAIPQTGPGTLYSGVNITTSISGVVVDESGQAINNATVNVNGSSTTTDANGQFMLSDITVDEQRAYVKVQKSGYFLGARAFTPSPGVISNVIIQMTARNFNGSFVNSAGGVINAGNGAELQFDPGDIALSNGNPYSGNVYVAAKYIDPTGPQFDIRMLGDLQALRADGQHVILTSYGMVAVELLGDNGAQLNIAPGQTVTMKLPIPVSLQGSAPTTLKAYHFDEIQGNWTEAHAASRIGNDYVSEVSHFSFWNYGLWYPPRNFYCELQGPSGDPMFGMHISMTGSNSEQWGWSYTDATGILNGQIPATVDVIFTVYDLCGNTLYTQNLGSGTTNINLGVLNISPSAGMGLLTGTVEDCFNNPVSNALVYVSLPYPNLFTTPYYLLETDAGGNFGVYISHCNNPVDVTGYDVPNLTLSATTSVPAGSTMSAGILQACTPIDEYIYFNLDGTDYSIIDFNNEVRAWRSEYLNGNPSSDSLCIEGIPFSATVGEFWFYIPSITPGTYPNCLMPYSDPQANLQIIDMLFSGSGIAFDTGPNSITVNLNSYGGQGGYAEGTFSGSFTDNQGGSHTITGGQFRALIQN